MKIIGEKIIIILIFCRLILMENLTTKSTITETFATIMGELNSCSLFLPRVYDTNPDAYDAVYNAPRDKKPP
jgi:hypothetical protein